MICFCLLVFSIAGSNVYSNTTPAPHITHELSPTPPCPGLRQSPGGLMADPRGSLNRAGSRTPSSMPSMASISASPVPGGRPASLGEVQVIRELQHMREAPPAVPQGPGLGPHGLAAYASGQLLTGVGADPTRLSPRPPRCVGFEAYIPDNRNWWKLGVLYITKVNSFVAFLTVIICNHLLFVHSICSSL